MLSTRSPAQAPQHLLDALATRTKRQPVAGKLNGAAPHPTVSLDQCAADLRALENGAAFECRSAWLEIGSALHFETRGSDEGRELWHEWSRKHGTYDFDNTERAWHSF